MSFRLSTAAKLLHRPHLITPQAAEYWARRLHELDARAFRRPGRLDALARKLGLGRDRPHAWDDDDDDGEREPLTKPVAYAPMWMGEPDKQLDWGWSIKDGIAMMSIDGPLVEHGGWGLCEFMHGYDTISAAIDEFDAESSAKGGIIRFDTPGGVVASGIYELQAKLQARGPNAKPLWAVCEMAASAGYWIASQFDNVLAAQAGIVGSIGVVMVHENYAGALDKAGVVITSIEFPEGAFKTDGAWWKALSDEGQKALQSDINELGAAFLAAVEAGRGAKLTAEKARSFGAQVFPAMHSDPARNAVTLGLIDGVMSEQQAFEALKAQLASPTVTIPAPAGAAAASAAHPKPVNAATGATKEMDMMKTRAMVAAVLAAKPEAMTADEKLQEIQKILDEPSDDAPADAPPADNGDQSAEDKPADKTDKEARAGGKSAAAVKPDAATVLAILDLPEASGREKQARKLAETPGMTVDMAKGILAAGPKPSRLADRVTDHNVSANGGEKLTQEQRDIEAGAALARPKTASILPF